MTDPAEILDAIEAATTDDELAAVVAESREDIERHLLDCNHLFAEDREVLETALILIDGLAKRLGLPE